jgi:hypothetical protein
MKAALLLAAAASALSGFPPRVDVRPLTKQSFQRSEARLVGVGDCFAQVSLPERTELAVVTVELIGPWERTAEHVAKQAAAEIGANCLMPLQDYGPETEDYPVVRQYRAFLVTTVFTGPMGAFRWAAPASAFRRQAPPAAPAMPTLSRPEAPKPAKPAPAVEAPHGPVWFERALLESHDITLDLSRMSPAEWAAVREDVERYFPAEELRSLLLAQRQGESVLLDLRALRVIRHEEKAPAPAPRRLITRPLPL